MEVWRGFYDIVYAGPYSVDPLDRLFFTDKVSFTLANDLDGLFAQDEISFYGISKFQQDIGEQRQPLIIGASTQTVTTTYVLEILRAESFKQVYTLLPLLNVKVIANISKLQVPTATTVFKGGTQIPIEIVPEKIPIEETFFNIAFTGISTGLQIISLITEFQLQIDQPLFFIEVMASQSTLISTAQIEITPVLSQAPFEQSTIINLNVADIIAVADPVLIISFRDITQFGATMDFACDQEVSILYYVSPVYDFIDYTKTTVEAWVKRGITIVRDTHIGYSLINDPLVPQTKFFTNLLQDTEYKVKAFFVSPQRPSSELIKEETFTINPRTGYDGIVDLVFKNPVFSPRKQWLLCLLAIEYAIPTEDIWTEDGLNCENDNIANYVQLYHTKNEGFINATIAEESQNLDSTSNQGDLLLEPLKQMSVLIFKSRREFQPVDIYNLLFKDQRDDLAITNFNVLFKDQAEISDMGNLIQLNLTPAPQIQGTPAVVQTQTSATLSGFTLSEDGFLLTVYGTPDQFGQTPTKAQITDVTSFTGFFYTSYKANESIQIEVSTTLTQNTAYEIYMIAFNNDPRRNALSQALVNVSFTTSAPTSTTGGNMVQVFGIFGLALYYILGVYMNTGI